jgi:succinate dehydrogenase / fumarate reductase iron-sulfur subunit
MPEPDAISENIGTGLMRLAFTVQRYNPEIDTHPHDEVYGLDVSRGLTVLDVLIRIKNEQDGGLTFRYSCRSAICGSCSMTINGGEKLACRTSVRKEWEQRRDITIRPLNNLPVLKDLAVDMSSFWQKNRAVGPWLREGARLSERRSTETLRLQSAPGPREGSRLGGSGAGGYKRDKESVLAGSGREGGIGGGNEQDPTGADPFATPDPAAFHNVDACIQCGACVAACTSHEAESAFLGPAALAKAYRFVADTREHEQARTGRLVALQESTGMWDCTRCNFCVQVCPKDVQPMEAIIRLRRAAIERGLTKTEGARHVIGFRDLIARSGRLNEAVMPLKVVGPNVARLLHIMPLGLRMLWKGKVPNPLHPPIPGIEHVRAILYRPEPRRDVSHLRPQVASDADG